MDLTVKRVDCYPVKIPFRDIPRRNMDRAFPHWRYFKLIEVELESGHTGIGEAMAYRGWRVFGDRVLGANAAEVMWDDSLGGLQIALFDAVARANGVPVHSLLGDRVQKRVPLGWWCIDMPSEDLVAECNRAVENGYTHIKIKGRPWFDIWKQVERLSESLPEEVVLGIDFNSTLVDADRAIPILKDLEQYPQIEFFETPIPHEDIEGNKEIRQAVDTNVVMHYGSGQPVLTQITEELCEGFVLGTGGTKQLMNEDAVCQISGLPGWVQYVGTGISAAFSIHCAAVMKATQLPCINCHQIYDRDLLVDFPEVNDGRVLVPETTGLGVTIDRDAVTELSIRLPHERPSPRRLVVTEWPDGRKLYSRGEDREDYREYVATGEIPFYEQGVTTRLLPKEDSDHWKRLYEQAADGPVLVKDSSTK